MGLVKRDNAIPQKAILAVVGILLALGIAWEYGLPLWNAIVWPAMPSVSLADRIPLFVGLVVLFVMIPVMVTFTKTVIGVGDL